MKHEEHKFSDVEAKVSVMRTGHCSKIASRGNQEQFCEACVSSTKKECAFTWNGEDNEGVCSSANPGWFGHIAWLPIIGRPLVIFRYGDVGSSHSALGCKLGGNK